MMLCVNMSPVGGGREGKGDGVFTGGGRKQRRDKVSTYIIQMSRGVA